MKITIVGAAGGEVTGSAYYVQARQASVLVDCGLFRGGKNAAVKEKIHPLGGFSAHAGQTDLLSWFDALAPVKPRTVPTHGEDGPREALARLLWQKYRLQALLPKMQESIEV